MAPREKFNDDVATIPADADCDDWGEDVGLAQRVQASEKVATRYLGRPKVPLKPMPGYCVVWPLGEIESTTKGGIVVSHSSGPVRGPIMAEVLFVGPVFLPDGSRPKSGDDFLYACPIAVGDKVWCLEVAGHPITWGAEEVRAIRYDEIYVVESSREG